MTFDGVNPMAFFYHAMQLSRMFLDFLLKCAATSPDHTLRIMVYLDEARPGNVRRPDDGRCTQCLYWSCIDYPNWWLSRRNGWKPFAYITLAAMSEAGVTDTMLFRHMVRRFDVNDGPNISDGIGFREDGGNITFIIKFRMGPLIADWKQHVSIFCLKGYNGTVPCRVCANTIGRCQFFDDHPHLLHVYSQEHERFVIMDAAGFQEIIDDLKHTAETRPSELKAMEIQVGVKYDDEGTLCDAEVMSRIQWPWVAYTDHMHTYAASGGIAQFQLNQFVLFLCSCNIDIGDIDNWIEQVRLPRGYCKLKKKFFATRIRKSRKAHIKAYASEVLTATMLLHFFVQVVVKPEAIEAMMMHLACFDLLQALISTLQMEGGREAADRLAELCRLHHELFNVLYPLCRKPKGHAAAHIAAFWHFWGRLAGCYAPERHHKLMKRIMSFSFNKVGKTALAYDIRKWFRQLEDPHIFMAEHLSGKIQDVDVRIKIGDLGEGRITKWASEMNTNFGSVHKHDLLDFGVFGFAYGFAEVNFEGSTHLAALVYVCVASGGKLKSQKVHCSTIRACSIRRPVPYFVEADGHIVTYLCPT